jgi:hypothetical protein
MYLARALIRLSASTFHCSVGFVVQPFRSVRQTNTTEEMMASIDRWIAIREARAAREGNVWKTRTEVRSLSFRVDHELYRRLRRYVIDHEDQTGQRIEHQTILEIALAEYLERNGPPLCCGAEASISRRCIGKISPRVRGSAGRGIL